MTGHTLQDAAVSVCISHKRDCSQWHQPESPVLPPPLQNPGWNWKQIGNSCTVSHPSETHCSSLLASPRGARSVPLDCSADKQSKCWAVPVDLASHSWRTPVAPNLLKQQWPRFSLLHMFLSQCQCFLNLHNFKGLSKIKSNMKTVVFLFVFCKHKEAVNYSVNSYNFQTSL